MDTTTPLDIRPARYTDAAAIHSVTQAAYGEYAETTTPSMALSETGRYVADSLGEGAFRAAVGEAGGRVVAAVRYKVTGEGLFFFRLAVHPEWRRQGIARALVEWLAGEAVRHHTNRLRCQVRMLVGRNVDLYRSLGFEVTDTHTIIRNGNPVQVATMERRVGSRPAAAAALAGAGADGFDQE